MKASLTALHKIFPYPKGNYSIDDCDDIKEIIIRYTSQDLTPRTIKGHKKERLIEPVYAPLADALYKYMRSAENFGETEFDTWHRKVCEQFQNNFNSSCESSARLPYGKAQKIVNMTFKNLLGCNGADQHLDKFTHCHMPLDSYTLDGWFKSDVIGWFNSQEENKKEKRKKGDIPPWSNLDFNTYAWIQKQIRNYLKSAKHIYQGEDGHPLTPFQAEFYIWPEQKWLRVAKGLSAQDILKDSFPAYKNEELAQMAQQFADMAKCLKKFE